MGYKRSWLLGLSLLAAIVVTLIGYSDRVLPTTMANVASTIAQAPSPASSLVPATPNAAPSPGVPSSPPTIPSIAVPLTTSTTPIANVPPLPIAGNYQDPAGRFKVGLLKGYTVSPMAGSVLVEATDGSVAYAVVAQAQPSSGAIGRFPSTDSESLARVAVAVLQRGEGFQPGTPQPEAGGGVVLDWTGSLTIAGKAQPVGGKILMRPNAKTILLLIITATEAGAAQVPGALAALAPSLQ